MGIFTEIVNTDTNKNVTSGEDKFSSVSKWWGKRAVVGGSCWGGADFESKGFSAGFVKPSDMAFE